MFGHKVIVLVLIKNCIGLPLSYKAGGSFSRKSSSLLKKASEVYDVYVSVTMNVLSDRSCFDSTDDLGVSIFRICSFAIAMRGRKYLRAV